MGDRALEILKGLFDEDNVEEKQEQYEEKLRRIVHPGIIEDIVNAAMNVAGYDRNETFAGSIPYNADETGIELLGMSEDSKRFKAIGGTVGYSASYVLPHFRGLSSGNFDAVLIVGAGLPTEYAGVEQTFRAIIMEKCRDPSKYLLVKGVRGTEQGKHTMAFETNDKEYAASHVESLGFKVE